MVPSYILCWSQRRKQSLCECDGGCHRRTLDARLRLQASLCGLWKGHGRALSTEMMSPTCRLGRVGLEASGERREGTGASGPVGKWIARIQAPGAGIAGSRGKVVAPAPSEPSQKSAFPKLLSLCHECQPFASFCFKSVALCKTGSATVTMALFVAEKCAFENSENHCAYGVSPWVGPPPQPRSLSARPAGWTRSCSVPETAGQAASLQECPAVWGPSLVGGEAGPVPARPCDARRRTGRSQETLPCSRLRS